MKEAALVFRGRMPGSVKLVARSQKMVEAKAQDRKSSIGIEVEI